MYNSNHGSRISSSHHPLDRVSGKVVDKEGEEENGAEDEQDLEDGPLEVVPDNVADRLDRIQEPHEGGIRTTTSTRHKIKEKFNIRSITAKDLLWLGQGIGLLSPEASWILFGLVSRHQYQFGLNFALKKKLEECEMLKEG